MDEFDVLEVQMEEVLFANPEFTFRDCAAELVKKGDLEYQALEDPYLYTALHKRFADVKARVSMGRYNLDI